MGFLCRFKVLSGFSLSIPFCHGLDSVLLGRALVDCTSSGTWYQVPSARCCFSCGRGAFVITCWLLHDCPVCFTVLLGALAPVFIAFTVPMIHVFVLSAFMPLALSARTRFSRTLSFGFNSAIGFNFMPPP